MTGMSIWNLMIRTAIIVSFLGLFVFIPAGTFEWLEGWICLITVLIVFEIMVVYFWEKDREMIKNRGSARAPKEKWDLILYFVLMASLFLELIIAGLDYRLSKPVVPGLISLIAYLLVLTGLVIYFLVMKENTYLSKIVEIQEEQQVISTGPYGIVRHPLYAGNSILAVGLAIYLGSLFALIPAASFIFLMAVRSVFEEKTLITELKGYEEYKEKVRFRMIPLIW